MAVKFSDNNDNLKEAYNTRSVEVLLESNFNYDHVYDNVDGKKTSSAKDSFSFVNDLLKTKK
jgi:hypothetical protein